MKRPLAIINLHPDEKHRVRVFIWGDKEDMYKALHGDIFAGSVLSDGEDDYGAYFGAPAIRLNGESGEIISRLVGNIHIPLENVGAGVFAHELQHFIQHWISLSRWDGGADEYWEPIADLAGGMTTEYWVKFYEKFAPYDPQSCA